MATVYGQVAGRWHDENGETMKRRTPKKVKAWEGWELELITKSPYSATMIAETTGHEVADVEAKFREYGIDIEGRRHLPDPEYIWDYWDCFD